MPSDNDRTIFTAAPIQRLALTIKELLVVIIMILGLMLVASTMCPHVIICRSDARYLVCGSNLRGIGTSAKIYANENGGAWPIPPFDDVSGGPILYTVEIGGGQGTQRSPNRRQQSLSGPEGAVELSPTRAFWMLARSGDVTLRNFHCPSGADMEDKTARIADYFDFTSYENVSYGYQVPFGSPATRPREGVNNELPLAADKGPFLNAEVPVPPDDLAITAERSRWRPYNSKNHAGDGQNILFADGHVSFSRTPLAGMESDNIYTAAFDNASQQSRVVGESPWRRNRFPYAPVVPNGKPFAGTDSLIFP